MKYIAAILFPVLLIGCVTDSGEQLPDPKPVSALSVKTVIVTGRTAMFTVVCEVPEPCWKFVRSEVSTTGQTITTMIFAQRITNDPCVQLLSSIEALSNVTVPSAGTYTFKFWQYGGSTIDTVLTVQ